MANKTDPGGQPGFRMEDNEANDSWVLVEDLGPLPETTAGGIQLVSDSSVNFGIIHAGRVVSAGAWMNKRSGTYAAPRGWLRKGDIVQFIPHSNWTLTGVGGRKILGVMSDDILTVPKGRLGNDDRCPCEPRGERGTEPATRASSLAHGRSAPLALF